jgi:hypothetical protein
MWRLLVCLVPLGLFYFWLYALCRVVAQATRRQPHP